MCVNIYVFFNIVIGMIHYILFVILYAFYIEYCSDYLPSVIFILDIYVCIYGVKNYYSSFTLLI